MPTKHWIVRIGVTQPIYRTGGGPTATAAATQAYGMVADNVCCKPTTLKVLRSPAKMTEILSDPRGWWGFERIPGTLQYRETQIIDLLTWLLHLEAAERYSCDICKTSAYVTYTVDYKAVKCTQCGDMEVIPDAGA